MLTSTDISRHISEKRLVGTLCDVINIATPTGEERPLAQHLAESLQAAHLNAHVQPLTDQQANAWARLDGESDGKSLLLYAPMDTVTSNAVDEDVPAIGPMLRSDMVAQAYVQDGHVLGLGAHNPKGHVACIVEAAYVLAALKENLAGSIFFGFGAGGMPTHPRAGLPDNTGHGVGAAALVKKLPNIDGCVIAKSGTSVTNEEVGFVWMSVSVKGTHTYVGSRHLLPYSNAIANASKLILRLEEWFEYWSEKYATDCVRPQGVVSFINSGWSRMPAFTGASCKFLVDLRFGPDQTAQSVQSEFTAKLRELMRDLSIEASVDCVQVIEASRTPLRDPIVQDTIGCWEELHGCKHEPFTLMSGATDANILRQSGIPTARIGLPKSDLPDLDFQLGMNSVSVSALRELTTLLVSSALRFTTGGADG